MPAVKRGRHVGEDLPAKLARLVAELPDVALQQFQTRRLAIFVHELAGVARDRRARAGQRRRVPEHARRAARHIVGVLMRELFEDRVEFGGRGAELEPRLELRARVGKEDLMDKRDRLRRALDVEDHGAKIAIGQPSGHTPRSTGGKYAGPKQTGWKVLSMPLCV